LHSDFNKTTNKNKKENENETTYHKHAVSSRIGADAYSVTCPYKTLETTDSIIVKKVVGSNVYSKNDYNIQPADMRKIGYTIRLFASGIWVYWGVFRSKVIGIYFGLHTETQNLLLLTNKHNGKKIVIDGPCRNM